MVDFEGYSDAEQYLRKEILDMYQFGFISTEIEVETLLVPYSMYTPWLPIPILENTLERNLVEVISECIKEIPVSEVDLLTELIKYLEIILHKNTDKVIYWKDAYDIIKKYIKILQLEKLIDWEIKVLSIFTNKNTKELAELKIKLLKYKE